MTVKLPPLSLARKAELDAAIATIRKDWTRHDVDLAKMAAHFESVSLPHVDGVDAATASREDRLARRDARYIMEALIEKAQPIRTARYGKQWKFLYEQLESIKFSQEISDAPPVLEFVEYALHSLVGKAMTANSLSEALAPGVSARNSTIGRIGGLAPKNPHRELALKLYDEIRPLKDNDTHARKAVISEIKKIAQQPPSHTTLIGWLEDRAENNASGLS